MSDYPELLFFDTFSHGSTQELNLDLVQFTNPVYVTEIRVIPLGARVQADFPGGVRLGATNPSEFSIEFFVNDLSTQGASKFQNLGTLEYNQNGPIHYVCENKQIPTDGLILRGWYTTVTLAVYGFITKTRPSALNLVAQNTTPAAETPPPRIISEHKTAEWVQQHAQVYHKEAAPFEEETPEWPQEKNEEEKAKWEKEDAKEPVPKEEIKIQHKARKSPEEHPKPSRRRSSAEIEFAERNSNHHDYKNHESKKPKNDRPKSPSRSKSKSQSRSEGKKKSTRYEEPPEIPEAVVVLTPEKREKPVEIVEATSPKPSNKETPSSTTFGTPTLAPEDVELISEEEISELEDNGSPSASNMQVIDEILETPPAETLTPLAHEDSLDMDQFEPILSGSSDIESEDDLDFQDVEFDQTDLLDEPNKIFNPFLFEVQPLTCIKSPCVSDYEWELVQQRNTDQSCSQDQVEKFKNLLTLIENKPFDESSDDWVINVESLIPLIKRGLLGCTDRSDTILRLLPLVNIGLDFDKAYKQPKPVFKVRHLKAGIYLTETLCHCSEEVNLDLIKSTNLQHKLLDLYEKEYLALSIKLTILKTLGVSLNYPSGVEQFVQFSNGENGYRRLIKIFRSTRPARVRYSVINLLRKLHLYETLENLYSSVTNAVDDKSSNRVAEVSDNIVMYLEETLRYLHESPFLISQPIRFLPLCSRFEFPEINLDPQLTVYSYFSHFRFLDILLTIITEPEFISHAHVVSCVLEILAEFLDSEEGMVFLSVHSGITNRILKILCNSDEQYTLSPQLGLHMAHRLYVLNLVDSFQHKCRVEQTVDIDSTQLVEILSSLYYLTFTSCGKYSVSHVLSRGDAIKPFLKALQCSRNSGRERRKSPGKAYVMDLMWIVIKCSDYVPFLERHRSDLIEVASWQSDSNNSSWLNPIRTESCFSYNDITDLCDYLKKFTEKAVTYPGELLTAVRILRYLALPSFSKKCADEDECVELKHKFVLIQLFSQEGLTYLISILHKVCNHYERPHLHVHTLAGKEGSTMISLVLPTVQLIRALIEYVVRCRDVEFKDLTAVPALLKTYCLMYFITQTSLIHFEAAETMKEIVETLLAYTQTVAVEPLSNSRSLNKSLWTSMMAEVLKFSLSVPEMFIPCLSLLSELLPLPLPMQTRNSLSDVEISLAINSRKLWSAHLLPLDGSLQELIGTLCFSSHSSLLQLLKRVCVQLADLGPPTALVVTRSILNAIWTDITGNERNLSNRCVRLLSVFACLLTHPPLKMTAIQITTGSSKTDETYSEFWSSLSAFLQSSQENNLCVVQGQECIISIVQSLLDIQISLYPLPTQCNALEVYLSNSLPPKNTFRVLCESLAKHLENASNTFSTFALIMRTYITVSEYDYGLYFLKNSLTENSNALWNMVSKLSSEWSKENPDYLSCLSSTLDFLKECSIIEHISESPVQWRTSSINSTELGNLLKWNQGNQEGVDTEKHPLVMIDTHLLECAADEEIFQTLHSNLSVIIAALNNTKMEESMENSSDIEPVLDPPEPLLTQFQSRSVFMVGDVEDERLSAASWLAVSALDDLEHETEQVICNLEEVIGSCVPTLSLDSELEKLGHKESVHHDQASKKTELNEPLTELESKPIPTVLAIKPAKSRGFIRPISGPHRNDAFRSRIPNSSRAPSLHVDDFIALEKHNQQAATAGYNRLIGKHPLQDTATNARNRIHSFLQDRGPHFHSTFRPSRGVVNSWHPVLAGVTSKQPGRTVVKTQPSVMRHPAGAPLMIRGADLMRFSLALRWPPPVHPVPPPPQLRHHPPPHASIHRHLRPPPPSFPPL